jgi:predicted nucleic acid-binding protein
VRTVVDASVAVKWYFPEPGAEAATRVLKAALGGERELLAPDLIVPEFANVLWKKVRRDECGAAEARLVLDAFRSDAPRLVEALPLASRALELALRLGESVYDCLYLALAIEREAALVTADTRLERVARDLLAKVELIA